MKNGFYMGYDASQLNESEIRRQARLLWDKGYYAAGYNTIRLGKVPDDQRFENLEMLAENLRSIGFQLDIALNCSIAPEAASRLITELGASMITLFDISDFSIAEKLFQSLNPGIRIAIEAKSDEIAQAAQIADIVILNVLSDDADFFEIARIQLDCCRKNDMNIALSKENFRAAVMSFGSAYQVGNLPEKFDYYRNEAIFIQRCMLGCPLILSGDIAEISEEYASLVCNDRLIQAAKLGPGKAIRYYDPWRILPEKNTICYDPSRVLLGKPMGTTFAFALILSCCLGDHPTNILPSDFGWKGRFSVRSWPDGELIGANLEAFEVHVEASEHPKAPCCRMYLLEKR